MLYIDCVLVASVDQVLHNSTLNNMGKLSIVIQTFGQELSFKVTLDEKVFGAGG